jgi:hypothetical protein
MREKKGGEERRNGRNSVWPFGTGNKEMQVARARVSLTGKLSGFSHLSSFGHRTKHTGVGGCGREIFASATCSLQFAKSSAATLLQQGKNNSPYLQRGKVK